MSVRFLLALNRLFKCPEHPFNTQASGGQSYPEWQFSRAASDLKLFAPEFSVDAILKASNEDANGDSQAKNVLDMCCGAGGKSVYYASLGANVTGLDKIEDYKAPAENLAAQKGVKLAAADARDAIPNGAVPHSSENITGGRTGPPGSFRFICADAANTSLPAESFDIIIMNDAMEHVEDPEAVLKECARLLKPKGKIFISFPPYGHPYGAHVSDLIGIPWVQLVFSDNEIGAAYSQLASDLPDGSKRVNFRFCKDSDGSWRNSYINKMTLRRFSGIREELRTLLNLRTLLYKEVPLRPWLSVPAKIPFLKEYLIRMAVCVLEKP